MPELLPGPRQEAAKKRNAALIAWAGAAAVGALTASPFLLVGGVGLSGWLTFRWLKFRGQWGLRF